MASLALVATLAPTIGANPAGAATAPLTTEDGLGIRVDENALNGPALDAIENALQPYVDDLIEDGATGPGAPFGSHVDLDISSDVELSLDFLVPGGSRPYGGLKVHADIEDIEIRYKMDPVWPFSDCYIWVRPDTGTVDATGKVDPTELPDAPLVVEPITATWDDEPSVSSDGVCWSYVAWQAVTNWWDGIWDSSDPQSTAAMIEEELNGVAQDLIDDLWADYVVPVVDSLEAFGITWGQLRTDDHGLIVTADVDATGGLSLPDPLGGPYDVSSAEDSGATSNVNTLLAARSEVTVTVHPNVVNQFMHAINQALNSQMGTLSIPGSVIEPLLLPENMRAGYNDNQWSVGIDVQEPYFTTPSGPGGRPQMQVPELTLTVRHPAYEFGFFPVAVFSGSMDGIDLITEVRSGSDNWGPALDPSGASVDLSTSQAAPFVTTHMTAESISPNAMLPIAQDIVDFFNDDLLVQHVSLAPIEIGGLSVSLCTGCSRVSGDQRYTEFFEVG